MLEIFLSIMLAISPTQEQETNYSEEDRTAFFEQSEPLQLTLLDQQILEIQEEIYLQNQEELEELRLQYAADQRQITCMADAVYFEARGEPYRGKVGVLNVIQNRVEDNRWPDNACDVVYQRTPRRGGRGTICQFSWACNNPIVRDQELYDEQFELASNFYYRPEEFGDPTRGSNFFHARYVNPRWPYQRRVQLGAHIFYEG